MGRHQPCPTMAVETGKRKAQKGEREEITMMKEPHPVLTPKSWTVKHEAYRSNSDIQLESDLLISG